MIPLYRLEKLQRSQCLRKAAKLFREAEQRYIVSGGLTAKEAEYFVSVAKMLAKDEMFSAAAAETLNTACTSFGLMSDSENRKGSEKEFRRALNTLYHLLLAETGRYQADWDFIDPEGALDPSRRRPFPGMQVYLEDIRSPFNIGSMFRAAESFGAEKIWLSPLSADPRHKRSERSAMGCVDIIPWQRLPCDPFSATFNEQAENSAPPSPFSELPVFALETGGTPLADFHFPVRGVLIAGSEELGVSPGALAAAESSLGRVSISTRGAKGSLNVSVAFGIVMHAWAEACRLQADLA